MTPRRGAVLPLLVIVLAGLAAGPAEASKAPTSSEATAITKAFLKGRDGEARIQKIRVSTADPSFAAVYYTIEIDEVAAKTYKPPSPVILEKGSGTKWKPVAKPPKKVTKDLKKKPKSKIRITGDVNATLTRPASCVSSPGFYAAGIYDPKSDTYLSIEFPEYTGPHTYPALGVRSVATLAVGNGGGVPQYETGQGNDAFASSGEIYVDAGRWGIIEAGMALYPDATTYPLSVSVSGTWDCR